MAACKLCKQGVKNRIREELQCDFGFIKQLMKSGTIQLLQDAYADPEAADTRVKEIMEEVKGRYGNYCRDFGLAFGADNRNNRDYLARQKNRENL